MQPEFAGASSTNKGQFNIAVKVFLRDNDKLLLLHDVFGDWDLPGGRILPDEFGGDIQDAIARKMHEELGDDVKYQIGNPVTTFQVNRIDFKTKLPALIFGVGFSATYLGGVIQHGPNHDKYLWADVAALNPDDYFQHGWEKGVADYLAKNEPAPES